MGEEISPIRTTGIGSWPGEDMADAIKIAFAECPELPYLPELPARGHHAAMIGRATALLSGLGVDLQPAGWRLTDGSGREHRAAKATVREDLDQLEEIAQGHQGKVKYSFSGPWTLTAMMERPRGDKILADPGARRDLGQSWAEGVAQLLLEMRRRLPDTRPVLQIDEPMLPSVLRGAVLTASGFSTHRVIQPPEVTEVYTMIRELLATSGLEVPVVVHCCAAGVPVGLLRQAGMEGVSFDLDQADTRTWDQVGTAMEHRLWLGAGALPTGQELTPDQVAARVLKPIRQLGLEPQVSSRMVLTPACGLAGSTRDGAIKALRTLRTAASVITDQLGD